MHKPPVVICHKHQTGSCERTVFIIPAIQLLMHLLTNDMKTHTNNVLKFKALLLFHFVLLFSVEGGN